MKGIFAEVGKIQDRISKLDEEIYNADIAAGKAGHMVDAIEAKYKLYDKNGEAHLTLLKSELLTDMQILEDYIRQTQAAIRNVSEEVLNNG